MAVAAARIGRAVVVASVAVVEIAVVAILGAVLSAVREAAGAEATRSGLESSGVHDRLDRWHTEGEAALEAARERPRAELIGHVKSSRVWKGGPALVAEQVPGMIGRFRGFA